MAMQLDRQLPLRAGRARSGQTKMRVRGRRPLAPGGRAHHEADLEQEGPPPPRELFRLVVDGGGNRFEPNRPPAVLLDDRGEEATIETVQAHGIHALAVE